MEMLNTKKQFFLFSFLMLQMAVFAHPLYVSIFLIDYNEQSEKLEVSVKIFAKDLSEALEKRGVSEVYIGEEREIPQADSLIIGYLNSKFSMVVNDKKTELHYIGKEMDTDALWCYFESGKIEDPEEFVVQCDLLTELFSTQNNVIQITKDRKTINMLLNKNNTKGSIKF